MVTNEFTISGILGIFGFVVSLILVIIKWVEYHESKYRINIELVYQTFPRFKKFTKKESEKLGLSSAPGEELSPLPPEIPFFGLSFNIVNNGKADIGIKQIVVYWREPKFGLDPYKKQNQFYHLLTGNIINPLQSFHENKHFILRSNEMEYKSLLLFVSPYIAKRLYEHRQLFKKEHKKPEVLGDLALLPKRIILEIIVTDVKNKETRKKVEFNS